MTISSHQTPSPPQQSVNNNSRKKMKTDGVTASNIHHHRHHHHHHHHHHHKSDDEEDDDDDDKRRRRSDKETDITKHSKRKGRDKSPSPRYRDRVKSSDTSSRRHSSSHTTSSVYNNDDDDGVSKTTSSRSKSASSPSRKRKSTNAENAAINASKKSRTKAQDRSSVTTPQTLSDQPSKPVSLDVANKEHFTTFDDNTKAQNDVTTSTSRVTVLNVLDPIQDSNVVVDVDRDIWQRTDHTLDDSFQYDITTSQGDTNSSALQCPYLDTIDRKLLDFDFEKVCSISLSKHNVYGCLTCGKYFQGRGTKSYACTHSLQEEHHMFMNLESGIIYCLPDGYEVNDASLNDIRFNLNPILSDKQIGELDSAINQSNALDGSQYLPGIIGLNNIKLTDWLNASVQALMRVRPLRDFFVRIDNYRSCKSTLVKAFGELVRKFWNPSLYRAHVSPHELLQEISSMSNRKFRIGEQSDPIYFISWFLNSIHTQLSGDPFGRRKTQSIITRTFQGEVQIESLSNKEEDVGEKRQNKLLYLSLELPQSPLFKDIHNESIIPQVPLFVLLEKFNGNKTEMLANGDLKRYSLTRLPQYLIIHMKRFTRNNFFLEKNSTIVNFPITGLDVKDCVLNEHDINLSPDKLSSRSVQYLRTFASKRGIELGNCIEKCDLVDRIHAAIRQQHTLGSKYNLVANVCHEGEPGKVESGYFHSHVWSRSNKQWYDIQDLHVKETMPQLVALSESYIQIWENSAVAAAEDEQ